MEQQNKKSEYFAFISYKREDEKWAKWLQKKLESYGFPVALRKENPGLPSKIRPIFRDQSELSGGNLKDEIEKGLEGSNYLIVICSPRAAKSPWVSKEVQYFIDHGRENNIIPFIIGGTPNASIPEYECFPEGLRQLSGERELLGININEMGRDAAAIKVVARMFNLRFDTLWQRHSRRQRRKRLLYIILAIATIIIALASYNYFRTTREYYANYEYCYGMPTGIDRLNKSELKSAFSHYVFESSRGKLRRVYRSNPFGHPIDETSSWSQFRTAILDIGYEGDKLASITFSDARNQPQYKFVYSDDYSKVDIKNVESGDSFSMFKSSSSTVENMTVGNELDLSKVFMNTKSQVSRYVYELDLCGYISKIHFKRYNGSNETGFDDNGICGIVYERDSAHRVTKKSYIDENGEYMEDKTGCSGCEYSYNNKGNIIRERFFNLCGANQLSDMGYALSKIDYNPTTSEITEYHYDIDGKPVMNIQNYHKLIYKLVRDTVFISYFDTSEKPTYMCYRQRGVGLFHKSKTVYNSDGLSAEISYFDTNGAPCYDLTRVHRMVAEYDNKGRCTKQISYNTKGERQINIYGVSEIQICYDGNTNNPKSIEYFRRPGIRANCANLSKREFTYSDNKLVKSVCYDSNNIPSYSPINMGAHIVNIEYDDFGNVSDLWLKDASGSTQYVPDNVFVHAKASYKNGNCVKIELYNKYGRPTMSQEGYAAMIMEYDERGRKIATEYLDTIGTPTVIPTGEFARVESVFDSQGREIETRTYGDDRTPTICSDGWSIKKQEFKNNNITRISCFDSNGNPIITSNLGAHAKICDYDQSGHLISEKYLGTNNEPIMTNFGVCEIKYQYNLQGLLIARTYYDNHGRPVSSIHNYHKLSQVYDSRNNLIAAKYFDIVGKLVVNSDLGYATCISQYNPAGLLLSTKVFDSKHKPTNDFKGVHYILNRYTSSGDQIMCAYLDKENNPVMTLSGNELFAILYHRYDKTGRYRGFVSFDDEYDEIKMGTILIKDGVENGMLWREHGLYAKLRTIDGTEREVNYFSTSPNDETYFSLLNKFFDVSLSEVKRLIKEATR